MTLCDYSLTNAKSLILLSVTGVEMVSRDSSSAQIFYFYCCLSFSIVAFIYFASFIYHGHSGAEAPFFFSL